MCTQQASKQFDRRFFLSFSPKTANKSQDKKDPQGQSAAETSSQQQTSNQSKKQEARELGPGGARHATQH
jgi:hypothetical protein